MIKKMYFASALLFLMIGCQEKQSNNDKIKIEDSNATNVDNSGETSEIIENDEKLSITESESSMIIKGNWTGEMNGKKLQIVIDNVNGTKLSGYNILGSNQRALKGNFQIGAWDQPCAKAFESTLNEPGDDKWDGVFTIKFVGYQDIDDSSNDLICEGPYKGVEAIGSWKSNNGKLMHDFFLTKQP